MKDQQLLGALAVYALTMVALVGLLRACESPARAGAQVDPDANVSVDDEATALGRTGVREAGIRAWRRDDISAIDAVVAFRARAIYRSSYLETLSRVTHSAFRNPEAPRPWIVQLHPPGFTTARPEAWPRGSDWDRRGLQNWNRTFERARALRLGEATHRCNLEPHAWGDFSAGQSYVERNPTAIVLDCGNTCTREPSAEGEPLGEVRLDRQGRPRCNVFVHLPLYASR